MDLANARQRLGGPKQRLIANAAVGLGTLFFLLLPTVLCCRSMYVEGQAKSAQAIAYKMKYVDTYVDSG